MACNIEYLSTKYFENGLPCPYKLKFGNEILIYPITVQDYTEFERCIDLLKLDKGLINDAEIISMSQLEFIATRLFTKKTLIEGTKIQIGLNEEEKFRSIFRLCLNEDYVIIGRDPNTEKCVVGVYEGIEEGNNKLKYTITNKEYLEICKIILFQNFYDYSDEYVNPDVMEQYNEYVRLKNKNISIPTLEKRKIFLMSRYRCSLDEINKMTYRVFSLLCNEYEDMEQYFVDNMYKTAYKFDVKENITYPLYRKKKDKFEDVFMSEQSLNNKLGNN